MAEREKTKAKPAAKAGSRRWRMALAALAMLMLVSSLVVSFWLVNSFLFSNNNHFRLKEVQVSSSGWWNKRTTKTRELLNLPSYDTNLFKLDLRELRAKLENHPSIRQAEVSRILPDTLEIKIIERIPRAFLNDIKSRWVIDDSGMIMDRESSIQMDNGLPVILGIDGRINLAPGGNIPELAPVLNLIMLTVTEFSDIKITSISVSNPRLLTIMLYYQGVDKRYIAYIPNNRINTSSDIREMLFKLRSNIDNALRAGDTRNVIHLGFSGMGVMR